MFPFKNKKKETPEPTPAPARPKIDRASKAAVNTRRNADKAAKISEPKAAPEPEKTSRFASMSFRSVGAIVHDSLWALMMIFAVWFMAILTTFSMTDPAWTHSSAKKSAEIHNLGGLAGAYVSDLVYYGLGLSAWWLVVAAMVWLYKNFRLFWQSEHEPYVPLLAGVGLSILLVFTPPLERLYFGTSLDDILPKGAGGYLGYFMANGLEVLLGKFGGILILSAIILVGLKLLAQFSYLELLMNLSKQIKIMWRDLTAKRQPTANPNTQAATRRLSQEARNIAAAPIEPPSNANSNRRALHITQPEPTEQPAPRPEKTPPREGEYILPDVDLLNAPSSEVVSVSPEKLQDIANSITEKLKEFNIEVTVVDAMIGAAITRFEIEPAKGVKGSQIVNLSKDLARSLSIQSVRVVETISGRNTMGIEIPNEHRQEVLLQEFFNAKIFHDAKSKLTMALGKGIGNDVTVGDLARMPHLLVGGMTGSGKSVGVNAMILSILFKAKPDEVRFIMIDPKMLELSVYEGIPHLLCPVVTDMKEAGNALNWCVAEMEKRYRLLSHVGVRNLAGYNEKIQAAKAEEKSIPNPFSLNPDEPEPLETLPQIVLVIDELADLMMTERKAVETQIARLAQKARAAGIHMIIATQRPSVDVITGLIKANVPTRMAFTVQSRVDSRTILDQMGAEALLKYGDLLFLQPGEAEPVRLQGAFVSDDEVHRVVEFIKAQAEPNYVDGILTGEALLDSPAAGETANANGASGGGNTDLFDQAVDFIVTSRKTSISALQRHLKIGYNRAANLMQELEDNGIVSPAESNGSRRILAQRPRDLLDEE